MHAKYQDTIRDAMKPKIGQPPIVSKLQGMLGELGIVDSCYDRRFTFTTMRMDDSMLEAWIGTVVELIEHHKGCN